MDDEMLQKMAASFAAGLLLGFFIFIFLGSYLAREDVYKEAILRGAAYYDVDEHGSPKFRFYDLRHQCQAIPATPQAR